jgi:hypothetical protein
MKAMELAVAQEDGWREIAISLIDWINERYRLWLLKNSLFIESDENWGM